MGDPHPLLVSIVDGDELARAGLPAMLAPYADRVAVVDGAPSRIALVDPFLKGDAPDDLHQSFDQPECERVVVYTYQRDPRLVDAAVAAGADGYLTKSDPAQQLVADLERIASGEMVVPLRPADDGPGVTHGRWALTEREADVMALLAKGMRNADIARSLGISPNTVKTHLRALFRKLEVETRAQAVALVLASPPGQDGHAAPAPATPHSA